MKTKKLLEKKWKEVNLYCNDLTEDLVKQRAFRVISFANAIVAPAYYLTFLKGVLPNHISRCTTIDYPFGLSDTKIRQHATIDAIKKGATIIDLVLPQHLLRVNKLEPLYSDIATHILICKERSVTLRIVMEYRHFDIELLKKIATTCGKMGVEYCLPSTGYFVDENTDNILASLSLCENNPLKIVTNGNIYTSKHIETIQKTELFGLRINWNSPNLVYNMLENLD